MTGKTIKLDSVDDIVRALDEAMLRQNVKTSDEEVTDDQVIQILEMINPTNIENATKTRDDLVCDIVLIDPNAPKLSNQ